MKKLILSLAVLSLFAASCDSGKKTDETSTATTTTTTPENASPAVEPTAAASDVPTFSNEEVNKGLADYKTMMDEYVKAIDSKDQAKIAELSKKYATWAQGAATWASKLKPDEAQKFGEYMQKLGKEWSEAAMKAAK